MTLGLALMDQVVPLTGPVLGEVRIVRLALPVQMNDVYVLFLVLLEG